MRHILLIIFGVMLGLNLASAQEESKIMTATSSLEDVLSNLKDSVQKMSLDNDQLTAKDSDMQKLVSQLQLQLGQVQEQEDALNKRAYRLHDIDDGRARQINGLEEENDDLYKHIQKTASNIKQVQEGLDTGYQENHQLLLKLKALQDSGLQATPLESPQTIAAQRRQKEKLKLMKMIYDSQLRQENLHQSILDAQKNAPLITAASALAHQQILKEQIKDLESQIVLSPNEKTLDTPSVSGQWDTSQVGQLEMELKNLEQNYTQLKKLMAEMEQKAQGARMTAAQQDEEEKLQNSIDDLNRQSVGLRADLDDLRSQMVDLDKRKSHLEALIHQLP